MHSAKEKRVKIRQNGIIVVIFLTFFGYKSAALGITYSRYELGT